MISASFAMCPSLNRRNNTQYLVVACKGIIEMEILTFSYGGKGVLIVYFTLVISSLDKTELVWY